MILIAVMLVACSADDVIGSTTVDRGELSTTTIDLLDGSKLEVVGPSELELTGYLFTIEVPVVQSNVYISPGVDPDDSAAVDQAAVLESDLGGGVRLWRADREGQPLFMTVDLGGWVAFLHVGNDTAPDTEFLLSLAEKLRGDAGENGVVLSNYDVDHFTPIWETLALRTRSILGSISAYGRWFREQRSTRTQPAVK
ncbi:MAG TPA: hypothetical protein VF148_10835 [Acidimicrobiia bacterium]